MPQAKRILLVDDEEIIVETVTARLEAAGYEVLVARDGPEGFGKAKTEAPDLIVLDLMLPAMNGYQVCRLLKQDALYRSLPIILFTARAQERDEKLGFECGANAYIRKPFENSELLGTIQRLLKGSVSRISHFP